jgi:hypothetical protein
MSHILDRPVWAALTTKQAHLAEGGPLAFRYPRDIVPFAAARDASDEAVAALAALARPGDDLVMPEVNELVIPPGFTTVFAAPLVQMASRRKCPTRASSRSVSPTQPRCWSWRR